MTNPRSDRLRRAWQSGKYSNRKYTLRWDCWTFAMDEFLRKNVKLMNIFDLLAAFDKEFHITRTKRAMETRLHILGLTTLNDELTATQVAHYLGIDKTTASEWIVFGFIEGEQQRPGRPHSIWRIKVPALELFIRSHPEMYDIQRMPQSQWRWLAEMTFRRDPLYSLKEVATIFDTQVQTLRQKIKDGLLKATPRVAQNGRVIKWFVKRSQLDQFISTFNLPLMIDNTVFRPHNEDNSAVVTAEAV